MNDELEQAGNPDEPGESRPPNAMVRTGDVSTADAANADVAEPAAQAQDQAPVNKLSVGYMMTRTMHYPNAYTWLLLLSAMDIMLTWVIMSFGGGELNPIAKWIIDHWQLTGMITYKFSLILFFIMICEIVGTLRDSTGQLLSRVSVCIAAVPVVWSLVLLARFSAS